jgi:hypothetical protein
VKLKDWFKRLLGRPEIQYIEGRVLRPCDSFLREDVRLNKATGRVEFVFWKAGEQGHAEPYWQPMGLGWEKFFEPYTVQTTKEQP